MHPHLKPKQLTGVVSKITMFLKNALLDQQTKTRNVSST